MASHIHSKPWTLTTQCGKKEVDSMSNEMRRTWQIDTSRDGGRWNKARKTAFYEAQDAHMRSLRPHDEVCATPSTQKLYTHLLDGCASTGGQDKMNYVPGRSTGLHLKASLYHGKYKNVKPKQLVLCDHLKNGKRIKWEVDERPKFNSHVLQEFSIKIKDSETQMSMTANFETFRPKHSISCPEMGADYMNR
jgi:hypothetical protein